MSEGLTLAKLIRARDLLDFAPEHSEPLPFPINAMFFGQPPRRRHRHPRKPIARWREQLARMEHKAQLRRWRNRTEVRNHYDAMRKSLKAGEVTTFMGFKFVAAKPTAAVLLDCGNEVEESAVRDVAANMLAGIRAKEMELLFAPRRVDQ